LQRAPAGSVRPGLLRLGRPFVARHQPAHRSTRRAFLATCFLCALCALRRTWFFFLARAFARALALAFAVVRCAAAADELASALIEPAGADANANDPDSTTIVSIQQSLRNIATLPSAHCRVPDAMSPSN
jgi:hypothetical protein